MSLSLYFVVVVVTFTGGSRIERKRGGGRGGMGRGAQFQGEYIAACSTLNLKNKMYRNLKGEEGLDPPGVATALIWTSKINFIWRDSPQYRTLATLHTAVIGGWRHTTIHNYTCNEKTPDY